MSDQDIEREAYMGMIEVVTTQGRRALFDSEVNHNHSVTLRICEAFRERRHSHDKIYPDRQIIEVNMSATQWARMVSSQGMMGTPCTINNIQGKRIDQPKLRKSMPIHKAEVLEGLEGVLATLDELGDTKLTRAQKDLVRKAHMELSDRIPFVVEAAEEHMESFTEKAKAEVESFISGSLKNIGLEALKGGFPLSLPGKPADDNEQ